MANPTLAHCGTCACCPGATVKCACVALNALAKVQEVETVEEAEVIYTPSRPKPLRPLYLNEGQSHEG